MSIYYKYASDGYKFVMLSYVDDCIYWYTSEKLVKWFLDKLGNIFHVSFLVYSHWFLYIRISQLKEHCILLDWSGCATSVVENYPDTATKTNNIFIKLTYLII